ncbi:hypothetical protein OH77DRAFT_303977 [Trametes cingulata]|nr:hypothetical protein OH77DRAFT_303977 [Trametes cingulata]
MRPFAPTGRQQGGARAITPTPGPQVPSKRSRYPATLRRPIARPSYPPTMTGTARGRLNQIAPRGDLVVPHLHLSRSPSGEPDRTAYPDKTLVYTLQPVKIDKTRGKDRSALPNRHEEELL